ncbi:DUF4426 domain-containing protein [Lysobacter sp. A3-1-A15]|uniref:DUF4426 domain-containing protein n=1 Tax=Novilysobacter viscosus TaxID=3098602 RepID=UPI002EDB5AAD
MRQHTRTPTAGLLGSHNATVSIRLLALAAVALSTACGNDDPAVNPAAVPITAPGSASQVTAQVGEASVTAVAIQTSQMPAEVAAEHGIEQRDDLVMLRVSPRQGEMGSLSTAPMQVRATMTGLRGTPRDIVLEERRVAGLVDHVGTVEVTLPDTLRFDVTVVSPQGQSGTLEFSREFRTR